MPLTPVNAPRVEILNAEEVSWNVPVALPMLVLAVPVVLRLAAPTTVREPSVPTPVILPNEPLARFAFVIVLLAIFVPVTAPAWIVATALLFRVTSPLIF